DAGETINHFHTPWWETFRRAVLFDWASSYMSGDEAIVIGLLGIDTEHALHTEIHPVWALAIHDLRRSSPSDDVWAIFARNWGNEGLCGQHQHLLDLQSITFKLPWRRGSSSVSVKPSADCGAAAGPYTQFCTNSSVSWSWSATR